MSLQCVDDLVDAEHRVRLVWDVVAGLDLSRFYDSVKAVAGAVGRDATDPRLLVAILLYGTIKGIGSARELARRCSSDAAFKWLCGDVTVNYHMISDFRVDHAEALDVLFMAVLTKLIHQRVVSVRRVSQDGTRIRAYSGTGSFRRRKSLEQIRAEAGEHVKEVRALIGDPAKCGGWSQKKKAAQLRAAKERRRRARAALQELPREIARQQAKKNGGKAPEQVRISVTDASTRVMKMGDGGFRPGHNVQIAVDPDSRAIVGIDVCNEGVDTYQSEPMRERIEQTTGEKVHEHLLDGGYLDHEQIQRAEQNDVKLIIPPKPPTKKMRAAGIDQYTPRDGDSPEIAAWRARMKSEESKAIYQQRGSSSETVNGDLKTHRTLGQVLVRGLKKVRCIALWNALAYNVLHFAAALIGN